MKKIAFGMACGLLAVFVTAMMLTMYGRQARQREAALMLAQDFSIPYEDGRNGKKQPIRPRLRKERRF